MRFNPFFIRASVYWASTNPSRTNVSSGFNPFFIRASVYCRALQGLQPHRLIRFNPFFIRASVYCQWYRFVSYVDRDEFQSLLHQGISLLHGSLVIPKVKEAPYVSIPSSSGHQFTAERFSAISVSPLIGFQSLLHQGISLLLCRRYPQHRPRSGCFNPFFIRASVYW